MHYVYVLFSRPDRKLYVGYTNDLNRRLKEHHSGLVKSTSERRPLKLIYYEAYLTSHEAARREKYLKGGNGRTQLKTQLYLSLNNLHYKCLKSSSDP
ncbi:GIY-YIG nuclease family protein [Patescibacteria group bacterium]|nr:GIY-YIG nuclease family protein [Patescibacteria group bacterium]MBU1705803.1 GIY-YIG nuclease family protein [Patescibacteria group bacterium]